ncbi:hypothetical protein AB5975_12775 [Pseudomonas putida]
MKFTEPVQAVKGIAQDHQRPTVTQHLQGPGYGALRIVFIEHGANLLNVWLQIKTTFAK